METLFCCVGILSVGLSLIYILGLFIPRKNACPNKSLKMPVLRPVRIQTENHGWFMRILVWLYEPRQWKLVSDWTYTLPSGVTILIPKGFLFDAASVPRPLWAWLNPSGVLLIPGLIHDYGYRYGQLWKNATAMTPAKPYMNAATRAEWDSLFLCVGNAVNGMIFINRVAYLAIRIFGCYARKKSKQTPPTPVVLHYFPYC